MNIKVLLHNKKLLGILALAAVVAGYSALLSPGLNQRKVIPVPYLSQRGTLESGCELISAIMVLRYYGCGVSVDEFAARVPTSRLTLTKKGLVGEHPSKAFIGDPRSPDGLGCYAPVISLAMNSFLSGSGKHAEALSGTDFGTLLSRYPERGVPVILWATSNMKEPAAGPRWTIRETGEAFQWISGEHCLVLIGSDRQNCYFRDPYKPNGIIPYERGAVEKCYRALGSQAVVIR